jgi:hypothetical protein
MLDGTVTSQKAPAKIAVIKVHTTVRNPLTPGEGFCKF